MKVCFIINPKSGAKGKAHFVETINSTIDTRKIDAIIRYTEAPHHATQIARECAEQQFDLVVAVGGDGSVNETGAGLINTNTALGIIPTGSGNGMARHLGISVDFKKAVSLINDCQFEAIDTLDVNGRFCIGTIGTGFDAYIAHLFSKAGTRGYSTYVKLVLAEFASYKSIHYNLSIDGKKVEHDCFLLTFANSSQFGNNAVIAPFADVKDGIIEISMMRKFPVYCAPHLIYRLMHNTIHQSKFFTGLKGKEIIIENKGDLLGHIDGEPVTFSGDVQIKVKPLSIKVARANHG